MGKVPVIANLRIIFSSCFFRVFKCSKQALRTWLFQECRLIPDQSLQWVSSGSRLNDSLQLTPSLYCKWWNDTVIGTRHSLARCNRQALILQQTSPLSFLPFNLPHNLQVIPRAYPGVAMVAMVSLNVTMDQNFFLIRFYGWTTKNKIIFRFWMYPLPSSLLQHVKYKHTGHKGKQ